MDFSLYVIISPKICRVTSAQGFPQISKGSQIFNTEKILEVIQAGATAIQLREDSSIETSEFAKIAKAIHQVTEKHNIPLVIHDRVDVAVFANAEGVELGKGCLDYHTARSLIGAQMFVGVSVTTQRQAELASKANASYVAIGPVYEPLPTEFQSPTAPPLGTAGVRKILNCCATFENRVPHLVSGGITPDNIQRVLFQSKARSKSVNGVVLHYTAYEDHGKMMRDIVEIKGLMKSRPRFLPGARSSDSFTLNLSKLNMGEKSMHLGAEELLPKVLSLVMRVGEREPVFGCLIPNSTKELVERISAAVGSVPDFNCDFEEMGMPDIISMPESCLISMDSITPKSRSTYIAGLKAYNLGGYPVIFEPTGATAIDPGRGELAADVMASGYVTLIKGNYMEILHLAGMDKNEDYIEIVKTIKDKEFKLQMVKHCEKLALRERCVVLATGLAYVLSDGERTVTVENGAPFLAKAGAQALGSVLAAYMAVEVDDPFFAVFSGLLLFTIASDQAYMSASTQGPGTFLPVFIDEIWEASKASSDKIRGGSWIKKALVEQVGN